MLKLLELVYMEEMQGNPSEFMNGNNLKQVSKTATHSHSDAPALTKSVNPNSLSIKS